MQECTEKHVTILFRGCSTQLQCFLGCFDTLLQGLRQVFVHCPLAAKPVWAMKRFMLQVDSAFHEIVVLSGIKHRGSMLSDLKTTVGLQRHLMGVRHCLSWGQQ